MTPVKYGLLYVGLAVAIAVGDALLRAIGRRSTLLTWPAFGCVGYAAVVLLVHPTAVWWAAGLAVVGLALPIGSAVTALRVSLAPASGSGAVAQAADVADQRAAWRADLERRVHELAAQLHAGAVSAEEWRNGVLGLAEEAAKG